MASTPYTMNNGVKPVDWFRVILKPQSTGGTFPAHCPELVDDAGFKGSKDHGVRTLHLAISLWVSDESPIDPNAESSQNWRNFFLVKSMSLLVIMEFGTPNLYMMSRKNSTMSSDLTLVIGLASIQLVNLSIITRRWV
jgi:hypothetical protein